MQTPYAEYMLRPRAPEPYTPTEKVLRSIVLTDDFLAYVTAELKRRDAPTLIDTQELDALFQTYTHKHFPISKADPNHFFDFILSTISTKQVDVRPPHRTRDPRYKKALPVPIMEERRRGPDTFETLR